MEGACIVQSLDKIAFPYYHVSCVFLPNPKEETNKLLNNFSSLKYVFAYTLNDERRNKWYEIDAIYHHTLEFWKNDTNVSLKTNYKLK